MTTDTVTDLTELARWLNTYARGYNGGAYASPLPVELGSGAWTIHDEHGPGRLVILSRILRQTSNRHDFTGRRFQLPAGSHLAQVYVTAAMPVPDLERFDVVVGYLDNRHLSDVCRAQDRELMAVQISAAGEMTAVWGREATGWRYEAADLATMVDVSLRIPAVVKEAARAEVLGLTGWDDDYPFYSDGTWSALSLRGFDPDPRWGVKPAEMNRKWQATHPGALARTCGWTTLPDAVPGVMAVLKAVTAALGKPELERVRLMRMAGGSEGRLRRHTDITDRAAGMGDGQIARFHVPIVTDPRVLMTCWDATGEAIERHLPAWSCWYFDQRKPHGVVNLADTDRIHLVIDAIVDARLRRMVADLAWPDINAWEQWRRAS